MDANYFSSLYQPSGGETIFSFDEGVGFSLVKNYSSKKIDADKKMFVRLYLDGSYLNGGVDMVRVKQDGGEEQYIVVNNFKKQKITNFSFFGSKEGIIFENDQVIYKNKKFTIKNFVEVLINNHLSDRLMWWRMINCFYRQFLSLVFWLIDSRYDEVKVMLSRIDASVEIDKKATKDEPFFNYFKISRNLLFSCLVLSTFCLVIYVCVDGYHETWFTLSNPLIVMVGFLSLFVLEKMYLFLNKSVECFVHRKAENFVYKLFYYQFNGKFKLKI